MQLGIQALFPVFLPRRTDSGTNVEEYDMSISQNENNLNQNFSILYQKLVELEESLKES